MMGFLTWLSQTLDSYTGLSPLSFFSILALMIITYNFISSLFISPDNNPQAQQAQQSQQAQDQAQQAQAVREMSNIFKQDMTREPVQLGRVTLSQLKPYDGSDPNRPLLMAIRGKVYDVSKGRLFYGPGGPYSMFAGRDATRALALMSFEPEDLTGDVEGLSEAEMEVLGDWEAKFAEKYHIVGELVEEEDDGDEHVEEEAKKDGDEHVEDKKDV